MMTATGPTPGTIYTYAEVDLVPGALVPEFTTGNNSASYITNVTP
jgi:hypothetical protein